MTPTSLYSLPAQMESLASALAYLKKASLGADPAAAVRAETAVEELLTNSVVHGGAGRTAQALVWLGVAADGEVLSLRYEDACAAFDPFPVIEAALHRAKNPMEQRLVGGLGLLMVYRLADQFRYVRENGRNRMDLSFLGRRIT